MSAALHYRTDEAEAGEQHCIGFRFGYYGSHQGAGYFILTQEIRIGELLRQVIRSAHEHRIVARSQVGESVGDLAIGNTV